jgi:FMN phosphatase YigB (HAD superfamily)
VGDSLQDDIQGAKAVGMEAVLIHWGSYDRPLPEKHRNQLKIIRDLSELLK